MLTINEIRQVKGDGEASCFSNVEDTSIPALQQWCHQLTISSRERAARNFLSHLKTFANSVKGYVQGIGDITAADRNSLREKWESAPQAGDYGMDGDYGEGSDPFEHIDGLGNGMYSLKQPALKVDPYGEPLGVTPRLVKVYQYAFFRLRWVF